MTDAVVHPLTGELINADDLGALRRIEADVDKHFAEIRLGSRPVYEARDKVRQRIAELQGIEHVRSVPRRWRSDAQNKTLKCPNCGQTSEVAA